MDYDGSRIIEYKGKMDFWLRQGKDGMDFWLRPEERGQIIK
jgi:hypothetical protein